VADVTGIVLAGGRSTRFGSDKLRALYRRAPLLHHPVARLSEVCDEVIVVLAPDAPAPILPDVPGVRIARDASPDGPLAGVHAGMSSVTTELALVAGGDMPELSVDVLRRMVSMAVERSADAVVLQEGDRTRPLPCVLRTRSALEFTRRMLDGTGRRLRDLVGGLGAEVLDEATWVSIDPSRGTLRDVDVPGDLMR
jgi:molybdopterin-guanine dinucleotide biosynthesis protein A